MSKILLVEDDLQIATLYSIKLENSGFEFLHAENGLAALKALSNFTPDLVLLDLHMPVMDGEAFLEAYRKQPAFIDTPVIILTNISKTEAPKTLWHLGITDYIVKAHTTPSELVQTIRQILDAD